MNPREFGSDVTATDIGVLYLPLRIGNAKAVLVVVPD